MIRAFEGWDFAERELGEEFRLLVINTHLYDRFLDSLAVVLGGDQGLEHTWVIGICVDFTNCNHFLFLFL